jgi:ribosome-associated protein
MLEITPTIRIPRDELHFTYARAGGPGGQNVNTVSSKVLLRWNAVASSCLPEDIKSRLLAQQRTHLTREGELLISSQKTRDQARNIEDCLEKLRGMILRALVPPKPRKRSRPTRASKERRLQNKRLQARRKASRQKPAPE